jgi:hypothetical protein
MTSIDIASARTAYDSRLARPGRALTPDLARGAMLLFIALANSANVVFASQPGLDPTPTGAGRILNFLLAAFVDSRAYPVFAVMFGYGLVQLARRRGAGDASGSCCAATVGWSGSGWCTPRCCTSVTSSPRTASSGSSPRCSS